MATNNPRNNDSTFTEASIDEDRLYQEDQVLWEFRTVFQNIHGQLLDSHEYDQLLTHQEQDYLENLYSDPTLVCLATGMATFGMLKGMRGIRNYMKQRRLRQQQQRQYGGGGGGYSMDAPTINPSTGMPHNNPQFPAPELPLPTTAGWRRFLTFSNFLDLSLSAGVGIATGAYLINMHEYEGELDQVPLMEGRSGISDTFCPPLLEEYERQWNMANSAGGDWQSNNQSEYNLGLVQVQFKEEAFTPAQHKDILQNPHIPNLQAYLGFVHNCQKRQALEQRIRQEGGISSDQPVAIPHPGVEAYYDEMNDGQEEDEWTQQEVSSWVSDQEEDS